MMDTYNLTIIHIHVYTFLPVFSHFLHLGYKLAITNVRRFFNKDYFKFCGEGNPMHTLLHYWPVSMSMRKWHLSQASLCISPEPSLLQCLKYGYAENIRFERKHAQKLTHHSTVYACLPLFLASLDFVNCLDPVQNQKNVSPNLDPNGLTLWAHLQCLLKVKEDLS